MMWRSFTRSQLSAFIATLFDYGILILCVELFHLHYSYGVALGAAGGAMINFFLNRHWSFEAHEEKLSGQLFRYFIIATGSLLLNTAGVYLLTEFVGLYYLVSQIFTSMSVGLLYNYPLHRFFVYKKKESHHEGTVHFTAQKPENSSQNPNPRASESSAV